MRGQPQPDFEGRSASALAKELNEKFPKFSFYLSLDALPEKQLPPKAKAHLKKISSAQAQSAWLLGRHALSNLATAHGLDQSETLFFATPHQSISLTHKSNIAVAVYSKQGQLGVGVDFEAARKIPVGGIQHFLSEKERRFIESPACKDSNFLALWTVKEALFKALPENSNRMLLDIEINDLNKFSGTALVPVCPQWRLHYDCVPFLSGFLSVATCWPS